MEPKPAPPHDEAWREERWEMLRHVNALTDKPMIALAFVWLVLLILDFTVGLDPLLQTISTVIWILFIVDFVIELIIAPDKSEYLERNWLTAISLVLPALRIFRIFRAFRVLRAARAARTSSLVRVVSSFNRGMRALQRVLGRRGLGTVVLLTIIVVFAGAAGMYAFESPAALSDDGHADLAAAGVGLSSYGEAVWWTAMLVTTIGSDYWPATPEGRILCWLISLYGFAVFGYITATIASYFVGAPLTELGARSSANAQEADRLRRENERLRLELAALGHSPPSGSEKE